MDFVSNLFSLMKIFKSLEFQDCAQFREKYKHYCEISFACIIFKTPATYILPPLAIIFCCQVDLLAVNQLYIICAKSAVVAAPEATPWMG